MKVSCKQETCCALFKCAGILACCSAFLVQLIITWQQFNQEATVTGISSSKSKVKHLPCLTFCPHSLVKNSVYPLTIEEFDKNSYQAADIFSNESLIRFNETSKWRLRKVAGPLVGTCFVTQYLQPVKDFNFSNTIYKLKRETDLHLYIHNPGK